MLKKKGWNSPDMFKMVLAIFFLVVFALLCFFLLLKRSGKNRTDCPVCRLPEMTWLKT